MKRFFLQRILPLSFLLAALQATTSFSAESHVYTVGVVPQFEARKLHKIWTPVINELKKNTGIRLKLNGARSIPAFEKALLDGEYDFAYMNPFHLLIANEAQGYKPLVRDVGRKLSGILTVRKDSPFTSVKDLEGMSIAFPSPNALGASLQMRAEIHDKFKIQIQPVYVNTHDSVYLNVFLKQTAAGGGVLKTLNRQKDKIKSALKIIHRTEPVAPHPFAVHPRVPDKIAKSIQQSLLATGKNPRGKNLLKNIPIKKIGIATLADYNPLKKMHLKRFYVKSN